MNSYRRRSKWSDGYINTLNITIGLSTYVAPTHGRPYESEWTGGPGYSAHWDMCRRTLACSNICVLNTREVAISGLVRTVWKYIGLIVNSELLTSVDRKVLLCIE